MKVIFLSTCYPTKSNPNLGVFIHQQAKALHSLGVEVFVVQPGDWYPPLGLHILRKDWTRYKKIQKSFLGNVEGLQVLHPKVFHMLPSRFFYRERWEHMGRAVGKFIKKQARLRDADWIYAHFLCHEGYAGTFASEIAGIKLAAIARGDDVHAWPNEKPILIQFLNKVFNEANILLANSKRLADDTLKWSNNVDKPEINVVYNGIDLDVFKPQPQYKETYKNQFGLEDNHKYLLCIATPVKLKGWLELLDAIKLLSDEFKNWKLVMVAPPRNNPDALDLLTEAENRNILDRVIYLGQVEHKRVPELMNACDAFVLPSYNEGLSNAVLEAMATGLTTITSEVGGHGEFIENGVNGLLIQPKSAEDLVNALRQLINGFIPVNPRAGALRIGSHQENGKILKGHLIG